MKKRKLSILCFILAVFITVAMANSVWADTTTTPAPSPARNQDKVEGSDKKAIVIADTGASAAFGKPGENIIIELPLAVNREYLPTRKYVLRNITIEPIIPVKQEDMKKWPFEINQTSYVKKMEDMTYGSMADVFYSFKISETANKGLYPVTFSINATVWRLDDINGTDIKEDIEFQLVTYVNVLEDGSQSQKINELGALAIASVDEDGAIIPAPAGNAGERVNLRLPIVNNGGNLSNISITPVISTSLDEWPFVVEAVNYGKSLPHMKHGDITFLEYDFKISPNISEGAKPINFRATYKENDVYMESLFSAYINVAKGKPEIKELPDSVPKLIITGYSIEPEVVYAEDEFQLVLNFQNTSHSSTIKNAGIVLTLEENSIMPAKGESDTRYINSLKPRGTTSSTFKLKALPTALNSTSTIAVTMDYENEKVVKGTATQGIVIPIKQKMEVSVEEPLIYDEDTAVGDPIAVSMAIVNKGRTKAFNLEIDIESEDILMFEKYYGGDLIPAGKHSADFQIIGGKIGTLTGDFVITYEDVDGEIFEERKPFQVEILSETSDTDKIIQGEIQQPKKKSALPWIGGTGGIGAIALGYLYRFKWRKK